MRMSARFMLIFGALFFSAASVGAATDAEVRLQDGRTLKGTLRRIQASLYLIQTETLLYEIAGEEIATVNGVTGQPDLPQTDHRLVRASMHEVIRANGDVELWTETRTTNEGPRVWTTFSFGAAEHELDLIQTLQTIDGHGNRLPHRIAKRADSDIYDVTVELAVPVLPGEEINLARRYLARDRVKREGDRFVLRFVGDFSEDRIVARKVQLPPGAEILHVDPQPNYRIEYDGAPLLFWRRYYPRGARIPVTIEYRLPAAGAARPE